MKIFASVVALICTILVSGCGESAQEKLAKQQLEQAERSKKIMGDGNAPLPKRGQKTGGL